MTTECITGLRRIGPFAQAQWRPQTDCFVQSRLSWCDPPSHNIWSQYLETYNHEVCSLVLTVATVHDWGWRQWTAKAHWPCGQLAMKPTMKSWVHECLLFNLTVTWRDSEQARCPLPRPHGLFHQRGGGEANLLFTRLDRSRIVDTIASDYMWPGIISP